VRRRGAILLLGAFALGAALRAFAQSPAMPLIGFLSSRSPDDTAHLVAAFRKGLAERGFSEGKNVAIEYRWARGQYDALPALAAELARARPAVIVATGGDMAATAAKAATQEIPIVFSIGADPVKAGLVASYGRPGANVTGINILTATLEAKRLELLHELLPKARTIGFLINPNFSEAANQLRDAEQAARAIGVQLYVLRANSDDEIDAAFKTIARRRIGALSAAAGPFFDTRRKKLVALAARYAVPTMYHFREYVVSGGLVSYGIDLPDAYRQVGAYAARILNGAKPAELPVVQSDKFTLIVNLKTASALGLAISRDFLTHVDEVIE
jgi:putative ABC transport system substrate-binding protein